MAASIRNLENCIRDSYRAEKAEPEEPAIPADYDELLRQLNVARVALPSEHRDGAADPFRETLLSMGPEGLQQLWDVLPEEDETRNGLLLRDIAQALLERAPLPVEEVADPATEGERRAARERREATDAFQEVVFDLYDTFLSPQWRQYRPNFSRLPPLVKWGNPYDLAPYTWDATSTLPYFGVECGVVSLPPANAKRGLLAWAAIAHECSGHDILSADAGLHAEIEQKLKQRIAKLPHELQPIGEYWIKRWDEAAADVMAIMNMGPAAAVALLGYFRARRRARGSRQALECVDKDPEGGHPIDIMRAAAWVAAIRRLAAGREDEAKEADRRHKARPKDGWDKYAKELRLSGKDELPPWADKLEAEARADLAITGEVPPDPADQDDPADPKRMIRLRVSRTGRPVYATFTQAMETAGYLLETLELPMITFGNASLQDFSNWTVDDEKAVEDIAKFLVKDFRSRPNEAFDEKLRELAKYRAELRFMAGYRRDGRTQPTEDYLTDKKSGLLSGIWADWSMAGLWAAHAVAAAIIVALDPPIWPPPNDGVINDGVIKANLKKLLKKGLSEADKAKLTAPFLMELEEEEDRKEIVAFVDHHIKFGKDDDKAIKAAATKLKEIRDEIAVRTVFHRLKKLLALMHNNNRRWGTEEEPSWSKSYPR